MSDNCTHYPCLNMKKLKENFNFKVSSVLKLITKKFYLRKNTQRALSVYYTARM